LHAKLNAQKRNENGNLKESTATEVSRNMKDLQAEKES
jgi:hypothetical protein